MKMDDRRDYLEALGFEEQPWGVLPPVMALEPFLVGKKPLMFLAERAEDLAEPFVSEARELFEKMILAMGLKSEEYLVESICFKNKTPEVLKEEFQKILKDKAPHVLVAMGDKSAALAFSENLSVPELRARSYPTSRLKLSSDCSAFVVATFHPSYLLKEPLMKKAAWDDLQWVMKKIKDLKVEGV